MATTLLGTHKGYEIRKSGKTLVRIYGKGEGDREMLGRYVSVDAAKAIINANLEHRVMTKEEYKLVYPNY